MVIEFKDAGLDIYATDPLVATIIKVTPAFLDDSRAYY